MNFNRSNPSPRYRELAGMYQQMHAEAAQPGAAPANEIYPGASLAPHASRIKGLVSITGAASLLDYGSGKGRQYQTALRLPDGTIVEDVQDYWGVDYVQCYDPAYLPFSNLPVARFDGVISTDVLEHCPEEDISWIIEEVFSFATRFVFVNIASYPALMHLPNGENAHCTVRPAEWWLAVVEAVAAHHPAVYWEAIVQSIIETSEGRVLQEIRLGSPSG